MFRNRFVGAYTWTIERNGARGMYTVTLRAGITLLHKMRFDTGRDAWRAYHSSPETFQSM